MPGVELEKEIKEFLSEKNYGPLARLKLNEEISGQKNLEEIWKVFSNYPGLKRYNLILKEPSHTLNTFLFC